MRLAHREHFPGLSPAWGAAMNLFSLVFALILAVLFTLLLLYIEAVERRKAPTTPAPEPHKAAVLLVGVHPPLLR